jgi:hypothetical protein
MECTEMRVGVPESHKCVTMAGMFLILFEEGDWKWRIV